MNAAVLLGSRWRELEGHHTRWRAVVERWRSDPRVGQLAVVDYPDFGRRALAAPARVETSWLDGVRSVRVAVPADPAGRWAGADRLVWWITAVRLRRALGWRPDLAVAATPLWVPVLRALRPAVAAFDAVDDWRAFAPAAKLRRHVEAGYRAAADLDAVTTPSAVLAERLAGDFGVRATVVPNGVDLARFSAPDAPRPEGLPAGPFAVYVGVVEERVDLDLIAALEAAGIEVVVAGPGSERGPVAPELIPGLLQAAAVGLVPHRVSPLTTSMDPLKTLEYLAAGLPVVSTPVPGSDLSPRIRVAATPREFVAATQAAMAEGRGPAPDPAVAGRDWSTVAARLLTVLTAGSRQIWRDPAVKSDGGGGAR